MKKLMIVMMTIFALSITAAASYAGWMENESGYSPWAGAYQSAKSGGRSSEYRASAMIGTYVHNKKGDYLGKITDLMIDPGSVLKTSVQTSNLCGAAAVVPPVRVGFMFPGTGLVIVEPASTTDVGAVPSCAGAPGTISGDIQMTSWAP